MVVLTWHDFIGSRAGAAGPQDGAGVPHCQWAAQTRKALNSSWTYTRTPVCKPIIYARSFNLKSSFQNDSELEEWRAISHHIYQQNVQVCVTTTQFASGGIESGPEVTWEFENGLYGRCGRGRGLENRGCQQHIHHHRRLVRQFRLQLVGGVKNG